MTGSQQFHVYRVDTFIVPSEARDEFLARVRRTHDLLREQSGFIHDLVLEQSGGPATFNFVTIVEWEDADAIEGARNAVGAVHERESFDPQELFSRLGIDADVATYTRIDC